jgi:hypothetical protein
VRILQSLARIAEEIRLISSPDSVSHFLSQSVLSLSTACFSAQIRFEAVKQPIVCADITVSRAFFEHYTAEEPIDVYFTSRVSGHFLQ